MSDFPTPPRPPTPQVMLHRLPDKSPDDALETTRKPSKYIILIMGSTAVAGKLQIARSVASGLSCPLYQGDSTHDSSAKAATVGVSATQNEARYQRMWLSKLTRTGLLFPEVSKPATAGFSGFGGSSPTSTSTSRRGSTSSVASVSSNLGTSPSVASSRNRDESALMSTSSPQHVVLPVTSTFPSNAATSGLNAVFTLSPEERIRRANPALMVLSHPELNRWHRLAIRNAVGDYAIGVIFIPLYDEGDEDGAVEEEHPSILRPLDPTRLSFPVSFGTSFGRARGWGNLDDEIKLNIDVNAAVKDKIFAIIEGVTHVMGAKP